MKPPFTQEVLLYASLSYTTSNSLHDCYPHQQNVEVTCHTELPLGIKSSLSIRAPGFSLLP